MSNFYFVLHIEPLYGSWHLSSIRSVVFVPHNYLKVDNERFPWPLGQLCFLSSYFTNFSSILWSLVSSTFPYHVLQRGYRNKRSVGSRAIFLLCVAFDSFL